MNTLSFKGVITALITPFKNEKPDFASLQKILEKQIEAKTDAIVLFGTTGEGASLSLAEKKSIFLLTKRILNNKTPIITCISTSITHIAVNIAKQFESWGSDANMVISPYYYKCTEEGIIKHFELISNSTNLPIIPYNVPARTNCDIFNYPNVINYFNQNKKVVAIKEADNSLNNCLNLLNKLKMPLLCGNDELIYECLTAGYKGCISVISNIFPSKIKEITSLILQNKASKAQEIFNNLIPVINILNTLPNPISVKYASSLIYNHSPILRLPLTEPEEKIKIEIKKTLQNFKESL